MIAPFPLTTLLCIAAVIAVYVARMVELRTKRDTLSGPIRELTTLRLFVLAGTLMCIGSIAEQVWLERPFRPALFVAGCICAVGAFWLRRAAIQALGRFWSLHVEIRAGHELVREGPFRWVRHPTYSSMVLELLSVGLLLQSAFTGTLVFLVFVPTLVWRIVTEEAALVAKFGDAYVTYQRTTPTLVPWRGPVDR